MQNDRKTTIAVGAGRRATLWTAQTLLVSELWDKLKVPARSTETLAEYLNLKKAQQDDLKDVGGFVGGMLHGTRRKAHNVAGRDIITLDLDNIPPGQKDSVLRRVDAMGCGYCVYSTRKHQPAAPRLRVLLPLDRTVTADEYEPIARKAAEYIGLEYADPSTFEPSRLMYWPSCCADSEYVYVVGDKPFISADGLLMQYANWRDVTEWPALPGQAAMRKSAVKQGDPGGKSGIVGTFCRTYDIYRAMDELIPGIYEPVDESPDRYTYVGGSTTGGAVVYDGGKFLYSHHATDPCSGKLVNAFDLVRLHRFGDQDDAAQPGTPVAKMPSYKSMRDYALGLPEIHARAISAAADFAGIQISNDDLSWIEQLEKNQEGAIKSCLGNISLIIENDLRFKGMLRRDLFNDRIMVDELPWHRQKGKPWCDVDSDQLRVLLDKSLSGKVSVTDIETAVNVAAEKFSFHPIKDYLNRIVWDGTPRLDTLFIDYLGADDTAYTRAVTRKAFAAAVARIYSPGCKFDTMTVLIGKQGRYKSQILNIMGGEWFSDSLRVFSGKEAEERLRGAWIIEVSELQGFARAEVENIKGFLSQQVDHYRPAYGRRMRDFPRECVFFGTTNVYNFQRDSTGGRRFWPIDIDKRERTKDVFEDLFAERDQLWAEAVCRYRSGEPLFISGEIKQTASDIQEKHRDRDEWEGLLGDFMNKPIPVDWESWDLFKRRNFLQGAFTFDSNRLPLEMRRRVSSIEFLCEYMGLDKKSIDKGLSRRVNQLLQSLTGWHRTEPYKTRLYGTVRGFERD